METSTALYNWTFWKTTTFHTKEELMDAMFAYKTTLADTIFHDCCSKIISRGRWDGVTRTYLLPRISDPIEYALDEFRRAMIDRDNFPLAVHALAQALNKESDTVHIDTMGNIVRDLLTP